MSIFFQGLSAGNPGSWVLFFVFLIVFVVLVAVVVRLFEKWINSAKIKIKKITTPFGSAEFQGEAAVQGERAASPHSACPHAKDIVRILQKQRSNLREVDKIEMVLIYRDLMNLAEDTINNIIPKMQSIFLSLLKDKRDNGADLLSDRAYHLYGLALSLTKRDVLHEFLRMVRENHFIEKEAASQFEEYKRMKSGNIINIFRRGLDRYYVEESPSRQEIYDSFMDVIADQRRNFDVSRMIEDCIEEMKVLSRRYHDRIQALEKETDESITVLFGGS